MILAHALWAIATLLDHTANRLARNADRRRNSGWGGQGWMD